MIPSGDASDITRLPHFPGSGETGRFWVLCARLSAPSSYSSRLSKVRTKTAPDWVSVMFGYPIAWRLIALVGDVRWITPNLITSINIIAALCGSFLLLLQDFRADVAATLLFFIHIVFDCADGTLARYRNRSSALGAFMDKIGDGAAFLAMTTIVGYRAFVSDGWFEGEPAIVVAGAVAGGLYLIVCYVYWVAAFYELKNQNQRTIVPGSNEHEPYNPTWGERAKELLYAQHKLVMFDAADFVMWIPLFVFLGQPGVAALLALVTQGITVAKVLITRGRAMAYLDRNL